MFRVWTLARRPPLSTCRAIHQSAVTNAVPESSTSNVAKWTPKSIRTGVIARKRGMTSMWDEHGARCPSHSSSITANVTTVRKDNSEYHAVQVAASDRPPKTTTRQMIGHFKKAGVPPKRIVREFPVTADAHVPVGAIGKGFQGVMKRWNFKGLRASHGVSVSHRSGGATGGHQDPGRIWPGKKMAGRMGGKRITTQNLHVVRIDNTLNLVFVRGCVPGVDDAHVLIRDAKKKMVASAQHNQAKGLYEKVLPKNVLDLPFPAGTEELAKTLPPIVVAPSQRTTSPFIPRE
ncbi:mitochondrial 50S ribosomal protein L3 [Lactarius psammicola]|nr:mitochondrial 50S ribosomal protein L3 [Lactarius psammicola]